MSSLLLISSALLIYGNSNCTAIEEDLAAVRKCSERYIALILKGDKSGLNEIIHPRYQAISLPGPPNLAKGDKSQTVCYWVNSGTSFVRLEDKIDKIRLFGHIAIETGTLSGTRFAFGATSEWYLLSYTRIWVKNSESWRLVHEQY